MQQAPDQLAAILASVQGITDEVKEQQLVARLGATLDAAKLAIADVGTVASDPGAASRRADRRAVGTDQGSAGRDLLASGQHLLDRSTRSSKSDGVQALPGSLVATIADLGPIFRPCAKAA